MHVSMVRIKANLPQLCPSLRRHMRASTTGLISVKICGGDRPENISVKSEFADSRTQIWDSLYKDLGSYCC